MTPTFTFTEALKLILVERDLLCDSGTAGWHPCGLPSLPGFHSSGKTLIVPDQIHYLHVTSTTKKPWDGKSGA